MKALTLINLLKLVYWPSFSNQLFSHYNMSTCILLLSCGYTIEHKWFECLWIGPGYFHCKFLTVMTLVKKVIYLKLKMFILCIVQNIFLWHFAQDLLIDNKYNETLFGVLLVHNAHFLILNLKCVLMVTVNEDCLIMIIILFTLNNISL